MDRYAFVLESLRESDYRRLRQYERRSAARFSTWLVVVAGRLCVDFHRKRYGSAAAAPDNDENDWRSHFRRRLVDLVSVKLDLSSISDAGATPPDARVRRVELQNALARALDGLEARDRWLLRLRFHDELPAREITSIMGYPTLFHVYRRVNKVLGKLRASLESEGIMDSRP